MSETTNFRDGYLDRQADFGRLMTLVQLVADNQAVVLEAGQGLLRLTSDNTTATNRTFTITNGGVEGQNLIIILESGASTTCQLANSGNVKLVAEWLPTQWNALQLVWNGTYWVEANRDSGADSQGAAVADLGAFTDLELAAPTAAALDVDSPTAAALTIDAPVAAAQGVAYDQTDINTALDAKADQAAVSTLVTAMNAALDLKVDQADIETFDTALNTALDLKADQDKLLTMITTLNTDLDALYVKVDALLTSLRNAGVIAP